MQERDVTAQIWGITYSQIWAKKGTMQNLRNFLINIARHCESAVECLFGKQVFFQITLER